MSTIAQDREQSYRTALEAVRAWLGTVERDSPLMVKENAKKARAEAEKALEGS